MIHILFIIIHLYKPSLLLLIYGNCCMLQKKWPILYIYFLFFLSLIYIINYYIDRKKYATYATKHLKVLVLLRFSCCRIVASCCTCCKNCCRNCCTYSNFVLHFVASSIYCKLQQSATNIFYHFFNFCNRKCAILQHNLQRIFIHERCIFIHLQHFLQQIFNLISL